MSAAGRLDVRAGGLDGCVVARLGRVECRLGGAHRLLKDRVVEPGEGLALRHLVAKTYEKLRNLACPSGPNIERKVHLLAGLHRSGRGNSAHHRGTKRGG